MLVDETPRSFVKKNNSYSHCPLKKRPVNVELAEDVPKTEIKEEMIDVVDDIPEPENLSTKPEDLRRTAPKRSRSPSPIGPSSPLAQCPVYVKRSPSPVQVKSQPSSPLVSHQHPHIPTPQYSPQYHPHYPTKAMTPPAAIAPVHPVAKKARVEVIQHNSPPSPPAPLHFMANPAKSVSMEPLEPLAHYASPAAAWARAAAAAQQPLHYAPAHFLPYHPAAGYRYHHQEHIYPSYPLQAAYPHSSPEHQSVSPSPPHPATIQRPLARSYASHWTTTASPDHCGLSPTSSLGSSAIRSPPPATPEDLSSPGSDSGRSSAGSVSVGSGQLHKLDKSPGSTANSASSPRYQCRDCAKSYSTFSGLNKHQTFHCAAAEGQTKKTFTCKTCEKVYMTLGALKMHIRTHTLPCKCNLCGKAFSRPWLLQGHIRTHTGEKPFSCQHCNRAFADRSNLRAHLQTHSDVKKYSCSSCSKTFSRMSLLTKHQEGGCPGVAVPIAYGC